MAEFVRPTVEVHASFLAAMAEFRAEGRGGPDDPSMIAEEMGAFGGCWHDPESFRRYVTWLRDQEREGAPRPAEYVPATTLWWVDDAHGYLGRLAIRHRLTPRLRQVGGHIGYDVRPTARRRGHATAMLAAALPVARALGIGDVFITCDVDNTASRRVIERNGGQPAGSVGRNLHFWIPAPT